jgi:hypothetical protein
VPMPARPTSFFRCGAVPGLVTLACWRRPVWRRRVGLHQRAGKPMRQSGEGVDDHWGLEGPVPPPTFTWRTMPAASRRFSASLVARKLRPMRSVAPVTETTGAPGYGRAGARPPIPSGGPRRRPANAHG